MTAGDRARHVSAGALGGLVVVWALLLVAGCTTTAPPPEEPEAVAHRLVEGVQLTATLRSSSLVAGDAIADFGVGQSVRLVRIRIAAEIALGLRLESPNDLVLAAPPTVCLYGPNAAPDDAGLEDRCWGMPDLGSTLEPLLDRDGAGNPLLRAGRPVVVDATVERSPARCDYPPGTWTVDVRLEPLIAGSPADARYVPEATLEVPFTRDEPLEAVDKSLYCGLASQVFREQGEPPVKD